MKKWIRYILSGLFILCFYLNAYSNNKVILRQISIEQGLPGVSLQSIHQDRFGLMWFGIESVGLCKYDGQEYWIYENIPGDSSSISNNFAQSIIEDVNGNIWVGTTGGLNKFNRKTGKFVRYLHIQKNDQSIPSNFINNIIEDKYGYLWVGTSNGLCKFNYNKNEFIHLLVNEQDNAEKLNVSSVHEDSEGNIWIGTWQKGIFKVTANNNFLNSKEWETKSVKELQNKITLINSFNNDPGIDNEIRCVSSDKRGNIYFGASQGIYLYNLFNEEIHKIILGNYGNNIIDQSIISSICLDRSNNLWIGTASNGLGIFDLNSKDLKYINANDKILYGLRSNSIRSIIEDNSGLVWIGTKFKGIHIYDPRQKVFEHIENLGNKKSLSHNYVLSICEDLDKNIWIGTKEGGLNKYEPVTGEFTVYKNNPHDANSLKSNRVEYILEENKRYLWIGTENSLEKFDKHTGQFKHYLNLHIKFLAKEKNDLLWVGSNVSGLFIFNKKTGTIERHNSKNKSLFDNKFYNIANLLRDSNGFLWIATSRNGLFRYRYDTDELIHYVNNPEDPKSISGNMIRSIYEDSMGQLWIGTKSDGLNILNRMDNTFKRITEDNGLPSNTIYNILEDDIGNLWMGTHNGLAKYNINEQKFENFNEVYGLQGKVFEISAALKSSDGLMYFGGSNGFNYFDPNKTAKTKYIAPVIISSLKVYDKQLDVDITSYQEYILNHDDKYISINYAILDYSYPINNTYAYMLENFDKDWIYPGNRHFASYTSLPAGNYIFRVKGANMDGDWNEEGINIKLIIPHPFWKKGWFITIMIIIALFMIFSLYLIRMKAVRRNEKYLMQIVKQKTSDLTKANKVLENQKNEIIEHNKLLIEQSKKISTQNDELEKHRTQLENLVSERTKDLEIAKQKAEESDQLKSAFLANMSHEIRTPLNAIVGFSDLLSSQEFDPEEIKRINKLIKTNSKSLLQLINDIIDISKIEANQIKINYEPFNVNSIVYGLFSSYQAQVTMNNIEKGLDIKLFMEIDSNENDLMLLGDEFRVEQIFNNLFSNALKYTKEGEITMGYDLNKKKKAITFYLKDTGVGIAPDNVKVIFDRFRKIEDDKKKLYRGAGLGLSICANLVEMMDGKIWAESEIGKGSVFKFKLPLNYSEKSFENIKPVEYINVTTPDWSKVNLLIVEDEESNIEVLKTMLAKTKINFNIANDGIQAVEMFNDSRLKYNIILMDIKLPKMNGIDATKKIRESDKNIPIIAQTAYAMHEEEREIMKVGFNGYLSKPILSSDLIKLMSRFI